VAASVFFIPCGPVRWAGRVRTVPVRLSPHRAGRPDHDRPCPEAAPASRQGLGRGPIGAQTPRNRLVEERGRAGSRADVLPANRPLPATRRHTPPNPCRCLGDKRSPVQIRAPRWHRQAVWASSGSFADVRSASKRLVLGSVEGIHPPPQGAAVHAALRVAHFGLGGFGGGEIVPAGAMLGESGGGFPDPTLLMWFSFRFERRGNVRGDRQVPASGLERCRRP
jgi:hypothetical protein